MSAISSGRLPPASARSKVNKGGHSKENVGHNWSSSEVAAGKALRAAQLVQKLYRRGKEPTPQLFRHFRAHRATINAVVYHPSDPLVATAGADKHVYLWDYNNLNKRALRFDGHEGPINDISFNPVGDLMITGSDDKSIGIWVPMVTGASYFFRGHTAPVRSVAFNPIQRDYFVSASDDKTVKLWNLDYTKSARKTTLKSHHFAASWSSHNNWVRSVRFKNDGTTLITASDDKSVQLMDTRCNDSSLKLPIGKGIPVHADFNPTAPNYFGVATGEEFHIYDQRKGTMVQCYRDIHTAAITNFDFHPSGDFAMTVSEDKTLKILDVIEGRPVFTIFGHKEGVKGIDISPDGMIVATGGKDKSLLIWKTVVIPYSDDDLRGAGLLRKSESRVNTPASASSAADTSDKGDDELVADSNDNMDSAQD